MHFDFKIISGWHTYYIEIYIHVTGIKLQLHKELFTAYY